MVSCFVQTLFKSGKFKIGMCLYIVDIWDYFWIDNFQPYFFLLQLVQEEKKEDILSLVQIIFQPH